MAKEFEAGYAREEGWREEGEADERKKKPTYVNEALRRRDQRPDKPGDWSGKKQTGTPGGEETKKKRMWEPKEDYE